MSLITQKKKELRTLFKERRENLSKEEVEENSLQIGRNFITKLLPNLYKGSSDKTFSLYLPSRNEVCTSSIAHYFVQNQIKFSYPRITNINQPLEFILFEEKQTLAANKFFPKILEPLNGIEIIPNILILPLLSFDTDLSRLGMGGGFFDRTIETLKKQNPKLTIIGLAYDFQCFADILPIENTDQRLNFIVTQTRILSRT